MLVCRPNCPPLAKRISTQQRLIFYCQSTTEFRPSLWRGLDFLIYFQNASWSSLKPKLSSPSRWSSIQGCNVVDRVKIRESSCGRGGVLSVVTTHLSTSARRPCQACFVRASLFVSGSITAPKQVKGPQLAASSISQRSHHMSCSWERAPVRPYGQREQAGAPKSNPS